MNYRAEKGFSAPPEVVFNVATDPDRLPRWLPGPLRIVDTGRECLRVVWADNRAAEAGPEEGAEYRIVVLPERLRVEWRPSGPDGWSGYLQVQENAAGGAIGEVCVEAVGHAAESRGSDQASRILESTLVNLRTEVADNLTAG